MLQFIAAAACAVCLYAIVADVLELVRYEGTLRKRIKFERLHVRIVDNR